MHKQVSLDLSTGSPRHKRLGSVVSAHFSSGGSSLYREGNGRRLFILVSCVSVVLTVILLTSLLTYFWLQGDRADYQNVADTLDWEDPDLRLIARRFIKQLQTGRQSYTLLLRVVNVTLLDRTCDSTGGVCSYALKAHICINCARLCGKSFKTECAIVATMKGNSYEFVDFPYQAQHCIERIMNAREFHRSYDSQID